MVAGAFVVFERVVCFNVCLLSARMLSFGFKLISSWRCLWRSKRAL